ncbi:MAG: formylglycine-generating enzyme family protein [Mariprofundaceae bacterium]|nr:formylglycine-generating enzyme family protein [Mariprofundaceae bacterium]
MARQPISKKELKRRKKIAMAVFLTCIAGAMIGGSIHVMELGSMRMDEMRAKISYDPTDISQHVRAAGEDILIQAKNEARVDEHIFYTASSVKALLAPEIWHELASVIEVPAGDFSMGTDASRANHEDKPKHTVDVPKFWIDKYPVTQAQYAKFVISKHYRPPLNWSDGEIPKGLNDHPVTLVSWYNARDYCAWVGKRLPDEAEWEKAARGTDARRWPWGDKMDVSRLNTYYQIGHTTPVTKYEHGASAYGVMDMSGNVSEWTFNALSKYPDGTLHTKLSPVQDQFKGVGQESVEGIVKRVMRGGSWKGDPFSTVVYHRNYSLPNMASDFYGFRCASSKPPHEVQP